MTNPDKISYTDAINGARKGDEDSFEFLYNDSIRRIRARCMRPFDPATAAGRQSIDEAVGEIFVRLYDRIRKLADPEDYPILENAVVREVCKKRLPKKTLKLASEPYLSVGTEGDAPVRDIPLVSAEECRAEVFTETSPEPETLGKVVLSTLHTMEPAERYVLLRWNANDETAMEEGDALRRAFVKAEKAVMEHEELLSFRARDFAKSRLAFFNWMLDLYNRYYETETAGWDGAPEPGYAVLLDGEGAAPSGRMTTGASPASFPIIWNAIRQNFYLQNTMELPGGMEALAKAARAETGDDYTVYLDGDGEEGPDDELPVNEPRTKKPFFRTMAGRIVLGLILIALVLAGVIATAGQHTSFAQTEIKLSVQSADFDFSEPAGFNGS